MTQWKDIRLHYVRERSQVVQPIAAWPAEIENNASLGGLDGGVDFDEVELENFIAAFVRIV
jgi:hypothetical protein